MPLPLRRVALPLLLSLATAGSSSPAVRWQTLQPGVELGIGPGSLYVVRVDPRRARLHVALASENGGSRTAAQWCQKEGLSIAINLGMFQTDQRSNVGYLRHGSHANNPRWNSYKSVLAASPKDPSLTPLVWRDLDQVKDTADLSRYEIVVQNLRLIASNRKNVWARSEKRWSEAAIAVDGQGRLLFLFSRAPYSMRDFNNLVLALPLNITAAMHVEGGPEASLSIHTASVNVDLCGSYETGFRLDDTNREQWPIPNVLGVSK